MEYTSYYFFILSAIAMNIAPGPDMVYIVSRTLALGPRVGIVTVLGVCSGALVHLFFATAGLAALLASSDFAFNIVKYAGAIYLAYLGVRIIISAGSGIKIPENVKLVSLKKAYIQGVLIDILNPKVALFFLAFLPQFVRPNYGYESLQMLLLGLAVISIALITEFIIVFFSNKVRSVVTSSKKFLFLLNSILGLLLCVIGIKIIFTPI
jgi:threonine/homoserine/homoserine lactone efflux protein